MLDNVILAKDTILLIKTKFDSFLVLSLIFLKIITFSDATFDGSDTADSAMVSIVSDTVDITSVLAEMALYDKIRARQPSSRSHLDRMLLYSLL